MTIIVTKSGQALTTRAHGRKNARGEIVGTEDLVRHLSEAGHHVVYFGDVYGDLGVQAIKPNNSRISQWMTAREQKERFADDVRRLEDVVRGSARPPLWVEFTGMPASFSFIDNPRGVQPQMSAMRYTAPMLNAMSHFRSPRVCVVTDIRAYPRDGEMSHGCPWLKPAAVLDQGGCAKEWDTTISFVDHRIRAVPGHSESWGYLDWREPSRDPPWRIVGISHCHVGTGFRKKSRLESWNALLGPQGDALDERCVMYGEGWEHWPGYDPRYFPGPLDQADCMTEISRAAASPVVSPDGRFLTSKPYLILSHGCIPIFAPCWGPGMTLPTRSSCWQRTREIYEMGYDERLSTWASMRWEQDFSVIDRLVEDYDSGLYERDEQEWHRRYGGYEER